MPTKLRHPCGSNYRTHAADLAQLRHPCGYGSPSILVSSLTCLKNKKKLKRGNGLLEPSGRVTVKVGRIEMLTPRDPDGAVDAAGAYRIAEAG